MARRAFPDPTKASVAVMTMAYKDYFFVKKWYDYYSALFGAEHLYLISHGSDPEHRRIAPNANVINVPRDPTLNRLERRRWKSLSTFYTGLLSYYNWVICGDVDEIIISDPDVFPKLPDYFVHLNAQPHPPKSVCPLGLELIHNPKLEPGDISNDRTILSQRRIFRINANYSKPCVLREAGTFTIGGHANTHIPRYLGEDLFLVHMRYFDYRLSFDRLTSRAEMRKTMQGEDTLKPLKGAWANDIKSLENLCSGVPESETVDFPEFRKKMTDNQTLLHDGKVAFWGGRRTKTLYRLPERFGAIF